MFDALGEEGITPQQLSKRWKVTPQAISLMCLQGRIKFCKIGGRYFFPESIKRRQIVSNVARTKHWRWEHY